MTTPMQEPPVDPAGAPRFGWRTGDVGRAALTVLALWFGLQLFWKVNELIFLVFLATLFGLAVARGVDYLERYKIRRGVGSALIVFVGLGVIGGGLAWTAPTLLEQGKELQTEFPAAVDKVQHWVDSKRGGLIGSLLNGSTPSTPTAPPTPVASATPTSKGAAATAAAAQQAQQVAQAQQVTPLASGSANSSRMTSLEANPLPRGATLKERLTGAVSGLGKYLVSFLSNTAAVFGAFVLIVFLAIYIGAEPDVYRGWLLSTVPAASRAQVRVVLRETSTVLRKWLVTQLVAMVVIGVTCTVVLLLLGVKAPFALGFIAGLLEFIPTVGPIMSAVPAIIMGFVDSPEKALTVLIAYWAIQFLENNLLIPFLMRGEMDLPPAITLIAQTLMTLVFGFVGLMVAVPLTAAVLVPLRMIAERENERERALHRARKSEEMLTDAVDPDVVVDDAGRGPKSPYSRLPSSTAQLKRQP